jgi:hypothetical protein
VADYDKLLPGAWHARRDRARACRRPGRVLQASPMPDAPLAGWSHFAQFTIAVVNKDPKKSKYSGEAAAAQRIRAGRAPAAVTWRLQHLRRLPCTDTLHRFCKKEHDWGWKKFMELSKVLDGFTVNDTLVIKAQVQVIL